jgi:hypothetical protein
MSTYLAELPERGWGVLRVGNEVVLILAAANLIKVQITPTKNVFQARLTGAGRRYRRGVPAGHTSLS